MNRIVRHLARWALVRSSFAASAANAAEIRVIAANAVKGPLTEIIASFERANGHRVTLAWGGAEAIASRISGGEADIGFQQVGELLHVRGIDYLGPLPAEIQNTTVYAIGLHALAPAPDAAGELVRALVAPEAGSILEKGGLDAP